MAKTLVVYSYYETNLAKFNLEFFINNGMENGNNVDYFLAVNGGECTVELGDKWCGKLLRENKGHDFAAWYESLTCVNKKSYSYFIFLNDTIVGPLGRKKWVTKFTSLLNERTKLCGISINCLDVSTFNSWSSYKIKDCTFCPHVQSMLWCTDRKGLQLLDPILSLGNLSSKLEVVVKKEIGMSRHLLSLGYNITCILPEYQLDYVNKQHSLNCDNGYGGDVFFPQAYFGKDLDAKVCIFFKNRRYMTKEVLGMINKIC